MTTFNSNPGKPLLKSFAETRADMFENALAVIWQTMWEQQCRDLFLPDEIIEILRKAKPAHMERQPEPEY